MKTIKKLLCLVLAVMLCFSLIGCNLIDEMRLSQIHFNEKTNLVYDGKEYILLPHCEPFSPDFSKGKSLYITEKDIPVLLSEMFCEYAELSSDKKYISASDNFGTEEFYARSDVYEEIAARINNGDYFDGYLYSYSYYDFDAADLKHIDKFISDEIQVAIDNIMSGEAEPDVDVSLLYQFSVLDIWEASKDKLFENYALTIYKTEKYIYLASAESDKVYIVPEDKVSMFEGLIKEYEMLTQNNQDDDFIFME